MARQWASSYRAHSIRHEQALKDRDVARDLRVDQRIRAKEYIAFPSLRALACAIGLPDEWVEHSMWRRFKSKLTKENYPAVLALAYSSNGTHLQT